MNSFYFLFDQHLTAVHLFLNSEYMKITCRCVTFMERKNLGVLKINNNWWSMSNSWGLIWDFSIILTGENSKLPLWPSPTSRWSSFMVDVCREGGHEWEEEGRGDDSLWWPQKITALKQKKKKKKKQGRLQTCRLSWDPSIPLLSHPTPPHPAAPHIPPTHTPVLLCSPSPSFLNQISAYLTT